MSGDASEGREPPAGGDLSGLYAHIGNQQAEVERLKARMEATAFARELGEAVLLTATAGTIATPVPFSQLLRMIVETAAEVISARSAALFLLDEAARELVFEVALGPKAEEVRHHRVPVGHGIAGLVAMSGQPMAVSDASNDPRQASDIAKSVGYLPQSILCVPLFYGDDVIGVLELLDKIDQPSFSAADIATLGLFANLAAVAITQSRAHSSLGALLNDLLQTRGDHAQQASGDMLRRLVERAGGEADATFRDAIDLAGMVQDIVWRGERERDACRTLLHGFARYLDSATLVPFDPGGLL